MGHSKRRTALWNERIGLLPLQKPIILPETTSIYDAINAMQENDTGCILVNSDNHLLSGILTERDIMTDYIGTSIAPETPLKELMSPDPAVLSPDTTVAEAVAYVGENKIRHFPVGLTKGRIVGLMSVRVLVDYVSDHMAEEILNLPPDSTIVARAADGG